VRGILVAAYSASCLDGVDNPAGFDCSAGVGRLCE